MTVTDDRLGELTEEYLSLLRRGEAPDISTFAALHPDCRDELKELLPLAVGLDEPADEALPDPASLPLPYSLGREFTLTKRIGRGGMGSVFEANQESLGRRCAVKILSDGMARIPELRGQFLRESKILARLRHPNIVTIHSAGCENGFYYYAMDLVEGPELSALAHTPDAVARIGMQAAVALDYAHSYGIFHCDIKPSNLLPDADGNIRIADFGLARLRAVSVRDCGGTRRYMAPERLQSNVCSRRTDLYALGLTLQELLAGEFPLSGLSDKALEQELLAGHLPPPKNCPPDLAAILRKMTAADPNERYTTLYHAAEDLRNFLDHRPVSAFRAGPLHRLHLSFVRRPVRTALRCLTAVALIAVPMTLSLLLLLSRQERKHAERLLGFTSAVIHSAADHFSDRGISVSSAQLALRLMEYLPGLLKNNLLPEEKRPAICRTFGLAAVTRERYDIAEIAYAALLKDQPSAVNANRYAECLYRLGHPDLGRAVSRRIVRDYGRLNDIAVRCEVFAARIRLAEERRERLADDLWRLFRSAPGHKATLLLLADLCEKDPQLVRMARPKGRPFTAFDLYRMLLHDHPGSADISIRLLWHASRWLSSATAEESALYLRDIGLASVEAVFLRRTRADDFLAQTAVSRYTTALSLWIRRTQNNLWQNADYIRCISSLQVLSLLKDFPPDVASVIAQAMTQRRMEDATQVASQSLKEAHEISRRIGYRAQPSAAEELFRELRQHPETKDISRPGSGFDEPLRRIRSELRTPSVPFNSPKPTPPTAPNRPPTPPDAPPPAGPSPASPSPTSPSPASPATPSPADPAG